MASITLVNTIMSQASIFVSRRRSGRLSSIKRVDRAAAPVFASRHAECAFIVAWTMPELTRYVAALRAGAVAHGRDPNDILVFQGVMIVLGETDEEAQAKFEDHKKYVNYEATLSTLSGYLGFDLGKFGPDDFLDTIDTNSMQAFAETVNKGAGQRFTVRMLAEWYGLGQGYCRNASQSGR